MTQNLDATGVIAAAEAIAQMSRPPDLYRWQGHDGRSLVARWIIAEHPDGSTGVVDLTISHWKSSKGYVASLNHVEVRVGEHGTGELSSPMQAVKVWQISVPRYNRKKHQEFAEQAIAAVRNVAHPLHAQIVAKFDDATRKHL